ncbi:hypothetical protein C8Q74DRAFT_3220 [Fomes fomentarius]|nr:hypothetical protein C8Q74DRAFT_3220 [Fomes fomentarius]
MDLMRSVTILDHSGGGHAQNMLTRLCPCSKAFIASISTVHHGWQQTRHRCNFCNCDTCSNERHGRDWSNGTRQPVLEQLKASSESSIYSGCPRQSTSWYKGKRIHASRVSGIAGAQALPRSTTIRNFLNTRLMHKHRPTDDSVAGITSHIGTSRSRHCARSLEKMPKFKSSVKRRKNSNHCMGFYCKHAEAVWRAIALRGVVFGMEELLDML